MPVAHRRATATPDFGFLSKRCRTSSRRRGSRGASCYNFKRISPVRLRVLISLALGVATGAYCWFWLRHFHQNAADFNWALWAAQDLLAHRNPYDRVMQYYPLPTALFGLPF